MQTQPRRARGIWLACALFCLFLPIAWAEGTDAWANATLKVYKRADRQAEAYGTVEAGCQMSLIATKGEWAKVLVKGKTGYVKKDGLDVVAPAEGTAVAASDELSAGKTLFAREDARLYKKSKTSSDVLSTVGRGESVRLLAVRDGWTKVQFGSVVGFMKKSALTTQKPEAEDLNALEAGDQGAEVKKLQQRLETLGYLDCAPDGDYGEETQKAVRRFQKAANLPEGGRADKATRAALYAQDAPKSAILEASLAKGDAGSAVTRLQTRLKAKKYFSDAVDGKYDGGTVNAVRAYQKVMGLTQTGKADRNTVKSLFGASAKTRPEDVVVANATSRRAIEMDWWTSDISTIFANEVVAVVTDVETRISWREIRRGGTNHADVQPLTAADTANMFQAVGEKWSWDRRAIWVTIGGVRYAASMNCMPHGGGSITTNDFDGHHCIHFTNSRTHGTNSVCEKHQAAIKVAASTRY